MAMTRMSKDAMDDKTGPLLKPEFITSIVALLAAEEHKGTGDCTYYLNSRFIATGAGYYSKIAIVEGAGVYFDSDAAPSPDAFAAVADTMRNVLRNLKNT
ncbi:hypothetical protein A9Q88_04490 [Gammaproteobacteria bacterium 50_400_T64]|nr:hypothetical protein A9Q88_04490 [Gammaproteobacteria bacterium 50_400_T64]